MKKNAALLLLLILGLASCKNTSENNAHTPAHTAKLYFTSSENHNISSYNIYNNDNLIMQLASTSTSTANQYEVDIDEIVEHPFTLDFSVEPLFLDSANANVSVNLEIWVDDEKVAENAQSSVTYGETAGLLYTGQ